MLPRIKIAYMNGQLGTVGESPDGLFALVMRMKSSEFQYVPIKIRSIEDLALYDGLTEDSEIELYRMVRQFYAEAEVGTEVYIFGVGIFDSYSTILSVDSDGPLRHLITSTKGAIRGIFIGSVHSRNGASPVNMDEGVMPVDGELEGGVMDTGISVGDDGVATLEAGDGTLVGVADMAQHLAEWATSELYAPLFVVLSGINYDGAPDFSEKGYNRVAIVIGDSQQSSGYDCVAILAGRLASIPVHRNCGRVKDGPLAPVDMYIGNFPLAEAEQYGIVADLYNKRYITPRMYVGRSGYYFADDNMACDPTDDYAHLAHRRVIDKAYRITYDTLLDMMLDELAVNEDGTLQVGVIKTWQQAVENAINAQMTFNGELSASEDNAGCECYINEKQNVLATSRVDVTVKVRPCGYARYIDVNLGFLVTNA